MKLYTEEQVRQAIKMADKYHYILDSEESEIISILESIELPSDEEIWEWAKMQSLNEPTGAEEFGRVYGAKWMRDKIKGGNK